jgi:hypothetical protein
MTDPRKLATSRLVRTRPETNKTSATIARWRVLQKPNRLRLYPDTNRFGVLASLAPDETGRPRTMMYVGREGTIYITGKVNRWTVIFCSCSNLYETSSSQVFSKFAGAWRVDG